MIKTISNRFFHKLCPKAQILIDQLYEGQSLDVKEDSFLTTHLMACAPCRAYESESRSLYSDLDTLASHPAPEGLIDKIMQGVHHAEKSKKLRQQRLLSAMAASILLFLVVGVVLFPENSMQNGAISPSSPQLAQLSSPQSGSSDSDPNDSLIAMGTGNSQTSDQPGTLSDFLGF